MEMQLLLLVLSASLFVAVAVYVFIKFRSASVKEDEMEIVRSRSGSVKEDEMESIRSTPTPKKPGKRANKLSSMYIPRNADGPVSKTRRLFLTNKGLRSYRTTINGKIPVRD